MPPDPPLDRTLLAAFLKDRDTPCPRCAHNLRGLESPVCPECGTPLNLSLAAPDPRGLWDAVALIAVLFTTLYFTLRAAAEILALFRDVPRGASLSALRTDVAITAAIESAIALLGLWWLATIVRHNRRTPRPIWARPTTAAAALLLAIFLAFLLAYAATALAGVAASNRRFGLLVSPMLSCEDAYHLARLALAVDPRAVLAVGPVPTRGQDKTFPPSNPNGYKVYAEKAPNARGVKRVLSALTSAPGSKAQLVDLADFTRSLKSNQFAAVILTGNYPSHWAPQDLLDAARAQAGGGNKTTIILLDTLASPLASAADILLPSSTWLEKAGTFENVNGVLQAFEAAIPPVEPSKPEAQIALDLAAVLAGAPAIVEAQTLVVSPAKQGQVPDAVRVLDAVGQMFNAADTRADMASIPGLESFATDVHMPALPVEQAPDMPMVTL